MIHMREGENMDESITQQVLSTVNRVRKIIGKFHPKNSLFPAEFMMLNTIHATMHGICSDNNDNPGVKISELSDKIHTTKSATSKMVKNLEDKGYIERVSDQRDRRVVYICLTSSGEEIIADAFRRMHQLTEKTIQKMGEEEAKDLIRTLNKFSDSLTGVIKDIAEEHNAHKGDNTD